MKVKTNIKGGALINNINHNESALKVRTAVKAGGTGPNHNETGLKVRTSA